MLPTAVSTLTGPGERPRIVVQLLGAFRIRVDNQLRILAASAARVVAYLALTDVAPRALAAGVLWPDVEQARANADLRTALWRLNHDIPGLVDTAGGLLTLGTVDVDVTHLEQWITAALAPPIGWDERLAPPAAGVPRELLPGWDDEWLEHPRERLRLLQLQAWESTASRLLANGRPGEALPYALNLTQTAPLRESAHQLLVEIFLRQGNTAEALALYERYRAMLQRELHTQPSLAFTTLIARFTPTITRRRAR